MDPFKITVTNPIETVGYLKDALQVTLENVAMWWRGLDLSNHITFLFFPADTLSKFEIRTFRGSTLGFSAYLAQKLSLKTDNDSVPADYVDSVVYRDNFVFILRCSLKRGSRTHAIPGVFPGGTSPVSLRLRGHCGTPPCG